MKEKLVVYKCTDCGFTVAIQTEEPILFDGCADTVYKCDGTMKRVGYGLLHVDVPPDGDVKAFIGDGEGNINPTKIKAFIP